MHAPKPTAVLFDLDGTIVDSAPDVAHSVSIAFAEIGRPPVSVETIKSLVGMGAPSLIKDALTMNGASTTPEETESVTKRFLQTYSENPVVHSALYPGALESIEAVRGRGVPIAICTNKPEKTTFPVMDAFGLADLFPIVLCGDRAKIRKPNGAHIIETLEMMNIHDTAGVVMIGDSENDIYAAQDAGVASVCVTFGYCHEPIEQMNPTVTIDTLHDLGPAIDDAVNKRWPA